MIGKKVGRSSSFRGRLEYCLYDKKEDLRGELVGISNSLEIAQLNNTMINLRMVNEMMQSQANMNTRVKKPCWHQIISFPTHERPDDDVLGQISKDFAEDFGFSQWLAIKHDDKQHLHIHFIGNIVDENGKVSVQDSNDHFRIVEFSRKMENKYSLTPTEGIRKQQSDGLINDHAQKIKKFIDLEIQNSQVKNLEDLQKKLIKIGIKSFTGRGITFIDKTTGVKIKGSDLGREYSKNKLEERIQTQVQLRLLNHQPHDVKLEEEPVKELLGGHTQKDDKDTSSNTEHIYSKISHAQSQDTELANDIRSTEEKKKDLKRRLGMNL